MLSEQSKAVLKESIKEVKYRKGHILLRANRTEKSIYFIKMGDSYDQKSPTGEIVTESSRPWWYPLEVFSEIKGNYFIIIILIDPL